MKGNFVRFGSFNKQEIQELRSCRWRLVETINLEVPKIKTKKPIYKKVQLGVSKNGIPIVENRTIS